MSEHPSEILARLYGQEIQCGHPCLYDALFLAVKVYANSAPLSYLEVGVSDGASLMMVLNNAPIRGLVICDSWLKVGGGTGRGSHAHIAALLHKHNYAGSVQYLDGDSHGLLPTLPPDLQFDLITVDGDHAPDGATADLEHVWPHLRIGGILVFDDVTRDELRRVWNQFMERHPSCQFLFEIRDHADGTVVARRTE
jgi:predicted O-methyltransferase YrrM